jgi:hydrogenase maturation factor HypE
MNNIEQKEVITIVNEAEISNKLAESIREMQKCNNYNCKNLINIVMTNICTTLHEQNNMMKERRNQERIDNAMEMTEVLKFLKDMMV